MTTAADRTVVDRWWQGFLATGTLPDTLPRVHGRLVRAVHRGELPSGPVHVKVMAFPRAKDRLRYLLRALPGEHEAHMLRAVAKAGIACPEVVDVRVARRFGQPFRSLLVLRTLPAAASDFSARERLRAEALLAARLLAAGVVHRDLHHDNFLPLADGTLAVLDLQSAAVVSPARAGSRRMALAVAARLMRDRPGLDDEAALDELQKAGFVRSAAEREAVRSRVAAERRRFRRTRVMRCLTESTEFTCRWRWSGREHRLRSGLGEGRWCRGAPGLRSAWLGQRVLQVECDRPPGFSAYFQKWWWLGGGGSLYVPERCSGERIHAEVKETTDAWLHFVTSLRT